jgi:Zn-dependent peptidase ImmA (M78 family)/predicted secreted protein
VNTAVRNAWLRGISGASEAHQAFRIREAHKDGLRPIDVFGAIQELEIPLVFEPLDHLLGACVRVESTTVGILITTERPLHMQRFTAAHELGHFILDHEGSLDREVRMPGNTTNRPLVEIEADAFAAEFLMPKWLVKATAERRGWWSEEPLSDPDVIYQLSLRLSVSYQAACWGLVSSDLVSHSIGSQLADKEPKEMKARALRGIQMSDSWADVWLLDEGDNGSHLDAGPNDLFIVELDEGAASGYRWDAAQAARSGFKILSDKSQHNENRVGAVSTRRLIFGAPPNGFHELQLHHRRSFSKRAEVQVFSVSISTRGATKADDPTPYAFAPAIH